MAQGKVEAVEAKTSAKGKIFYSVTIGGVKGSSFDEKFVALNGKIVEYESEVNGAYTNYKLIKEVLGNTPVQQQKQASPPVINVPVVTQGADLKLMAICKALECAVSGAKMTCKEGTVNSKDILTVADMYYKWISDKAFVL